MNKSDIKIIFVDIDFTVLNHFIHDFDYESLEALNKAQKNGVKIVISTSRPYDSMKHTNILKYIKPDAVVCTNGAIVMVGNKILRNHCYDEELVRQTISTCSKHHLVIEYSTEKERYFSIKRNCYCDRFFEVYAETDPGVKKYKHGNVSAMLLLAPEKYDEVLKKELSPKISYIRFDTYCVDLQIERTFKSDGIKILLDYYGISSDNALSIGDDIADIYMFKATKYSIALGNGKDEVKKAATFVTKHINEHGVKIGLEHYKVI